MVSLYALGLFLIVDPILHADEYKLSKPAKTDSTPKPAAEPSKTTNISVSGVVAAIISCFATYALLLLLLVDGVSGATFVLGGTIFGIMAVALATSCPTFGWIAAVIKVVMILAFLA